MAARAAGSGNSGAAMVPYIVIPCRPWSCSSATVAWVWFSDTVMPSACVSFPSRLTAKGPTMNSFGIVNSYMPAEPCTPSSLTLMGLLAESKLASNMREFVCIPTPYCTPA